MNQFSNFKAGLKIYPNPTSSLLTISNRDFSIETVKIVNLQGQVLFSKAYDNRNSIDVDLSSFANGIYMVNVNNQSNIKIIKK